MITQAFDLNLIPGGVKPVVKASQYDAGSRTLSISLFAGASAFPVPSGAEVLIQGTKQDSTGFQYECTFAGNVVTAEVAQQMTVFAGPVEVELQILSGGEVLGTGNFILQVEQAALADDTIISETDIPIIQRIPEYVSEAAGYAHDAQESAEEAAAVSKNLWYPTVDADGDISWQKSTSETVPATRNIKGPQGATGPTGPTGATGNGIASVTKIGSSGLVDTYRITFTDGTHYDYTVTNGSGPTYTEGDGIDISNDKISVDTTFTEASTRANIASGDSLATIWGKIKKFFTDLKTVAFSGASEDLDYDGTTSGLSATDAQGAIDEVADTVFESDALASGTDLNTITKAGHYYSPSNAITQSLVNCPVSQYGFEMEVMPFGTEAAQQIFAYDETYYRRSVADSWAKLAQPNVNNQFSAPQSIHGSLGVDQQNGTTTTVGESYLVVGNNKAQGTDGNSAAVMRLYGKGSSYADLQALNVTANQNIQLPNKSGTVALTSDVDAVLPKTISSVNGSQNTTYKFATEQATFYCLMTHQPYYAYSGLFYISRFGLSTCQIQEIKSDPSVTLSYDTSTGELVVTLGGQPRFLTLVKVAKTS